MNSNAKNRIFALGLCFLTISCQVRHDAEISKVMSNGQLTSEYPFVRRIERPVGNKLKVATGVLLASGFMLVPAPSLIKPN